MILDEIINNKKNEVKALKEKFKQPIKQSDMPQLRDFTGAVSKHGINLIAETKAASPSAGRIIGRYMPGKIAQAYESSGASAISVLTDQAYFNGKLGDIKKVKDQVRLPVLRKDFIIDEAQIFESRLAGADAILLITRILTGEKLESFIRTANDLGMAALVEVHSVPEARAALDCGAKLIGINNRDLDTLKVDLDVTASIIDALPGLKGKIVISESGISTRQDVEKLAAAGVNGILVGESLLKSADIPAKIKELIG